MNKQKTIEIGYHDLVILLSMVGRPINLEEIEVIARCKTVLQINGQKQIYIKEKELCQ